jgi:hypothetical protein
MYAPNIKFVLHGKKICSLTEQFLMFPPQKKKIVHSQNTELHASFLVAEEKVLKINP